jgi:hypothetical protein
MINIFNIMLDELYLFGTCKHSICTPKCPHVGGDAPNPPKERNDLFEIQE